MGIAETVYLLCAVASVACAWLLLRGYHYNRTRLLFWSSLCFGGLAVNNILTFLDLVVVTQVDLSMLRSAVALLSLMVLLYGLIWESK
ncbi:MAG TPA: DUF5985 family protein [Casimicrobiaceae bacterium]|nr:DUF5985 family protein [Casimicrobiaceae bacterium]